MEWLLILLILLAIIVNIRSFIALTQFKKQRNILLEDAQAVNSSMEAFVANLEQENDELYNRLVEHIAQKERRMEDRLYKLEQRLEKSHVTLSDESITEVTKLEAASLQNAVKSAETKIDPDLPENEKIEQLHKQGFSPAQIAKVVASERGEIELIINMFKRKQSYQK